MPGSSPALLSAPSMEMRAPSPSGRGDDMWGASLLSAVQSKATGGGPAGAGVFSNSTSPAPSPIEMPLRSRWNGRQATGESAPSELNPYSVVRHRLSTPPTTAASHSPASIMRAALPNAFALDEQAVDMAIAGPVRAK